MKYFHTSWSVFTVYFRYYFKHSEIPSSKPDWLANAKTNRETEKAKDGRRKSHDFSQRPLVNVISISSSVIALEFSNS